MIRKKRDTLSVNKPLDTVSQRIDPSPAFVTGRTVFTRIPEPRPAFPYRKIRCAQTAAFYPHPYFSFSGFRDRNVFYPRFLCILYYQRTHETHPATFFPTVFFTAASAFFKGGVRILFSFNHPYSLPTPSRTPTRGLHPVSPLNDELSET